MYSIYTALDCTNSPPTSGTPTKWNQRAFTFSTYFWEKWTGKQNAHLCNFYQIFCNFHVTLMVLSNLCYDETWMVPSNLPIWGNLEFQRHPVGLLDLLINRIKKVFSVSSVFRYPGSCNRLDVEPMCVTVCRIEMIISQKIYFLAIL